MVGERWGGKGGYGSFGQNWPDDAVGRCIGAAAPPFVAGRMRRRGNGGHDAHSSHIFARPDPNAHTNADANANPHTDTDTRQL